MRDMRQSRSRLLQALSLQHDSPLGHGADCLRTGRVTAPSSPFRQGRAERKRASGVATPRIHSRGESAATFRSCEEPSHSVEAFRRSSGVRSKIGIGDKHPVLSPYSSFKRNSGYLAPPRGRQTVWNPRKSVGGASQETTEAALYAAIEKIAAASTNYGGTTGSSMVRDAAIAYRAVSGGQQPGSVLVESE